MPKIFINYRRDDTKSEARLLYQSLIGKFKRDDVIMDIDTIPPTVDFREYLNKAVSDCDFLLALIGPNWVQAEAFKDPRDWVRVEIEAAIAQEKRIMPIMVNGGKIPSPSELPSSLEPFAYCNGLPLDTGRDFDVHVDRIVDWIKRLAEEDRAASKKPKLNTDAHCLENSDLTKTGLQKRHRPVFFFLLNAGLIVLWSLILLSVWIAFGSVYFEMLVKGNFSLGIPLLLGSLTAMFVLQFLIRRLMRRKKRLRAEVQAAIQQVFNDGSYRQNK